MIFSVFLVIFGTLILGERNNPASNAFQAFYGFPSIFITKHMQASSSFPYAINILQFVFNVATIYIALYLANKLVNFFIKKLKGIVKNERN